MYALLYKPETVKGAWYDSGCGSKGLEGKVGHVQPINGGFGDEKVERKGASILHRVLNEARVGT